MDSPLKILINLRSPQPSDPSILDTICCHPEITRLLAAAPAMLDRDRLTAREREVPVEIGWGRSNREIARTLRLAEKTAKAHVSAILAKLDVQDRTQAAHYAVRNGLV
jgi:DNA-binding NarL/FixJ family response regulator